MNDQMVELPRHNHRPASESFAAIAALEPDTPLRMVEDAREVLERPKGKTWNDLPAASNVKRQAYLLVALFFLLFFALLHMTRLVRF
jgi:hypothetical protein